MKFTDVIDLYFSDMRMRGRITSERTVVSYRQTLDAHAQDISNRDPRTTNRDDVKRTLRRWKHPNTIYRHRAVLVSFYKWCVWEGLRKDNPADQTAPPRKVQADVYRMTFDEVQRFLTAPGNRRERWLAWVGVLAGPRRQELIGFQGQHFQRPGYIWVSRDIGKGGRERFIPVLDDLKPIAAEIAQSVAPDQFVFPAQRWRNPTINHVDKRDLNDRPASEQAIWRAVGVLAKRAGIYGNVTPHSMRHAFGDHIARGTGNVRIAQFLLGHADLGTTETYLGAPTLDEMSRAVKGFTFFPEGERSFSPPAEQAVSSVEAPTGIEPVEAMSSVDQRAFVVGWFKEAQSYAEARGAFYRGALA